ncbi:hypothetical protein C8R45DRAFT_500359 [Mycena sanguinolenta]|nr:hypothetical protein C8R45DRAFT_500359 [Mycena sanguinolenta]
MRETARKRHGSSISQNMRHPNIMQLYGLMSTRRLRGMVFHDELIPCAQFLYRFEHSPILSTYIIGYCITEFSEAKDYIQNLSFPTYNLSVWIRSATGKLCVDLVQGGTGTRSELWWNADVSTRHPVGTQIFRSDSQDGTWVRITEPLILPEEELHWNDYGGELLPNSWIRYNSHRIPELHIRLSSRSYKIQRAWLAQANHIFAQLEEEAHVEDYVCVDHVRFMLRIADERHIPEGYLFVCPAQDFFARNEAHAKLYQWPACPAYWSLDPSGTDRLSMKAAKILGFPPIHFETSMFGSSWDHSVYKGLRRFHEGKGLDPESREVARGLGYPLYEVLSNLGSEVPFPCRDVGQFYCEVKDPALCREFGHYL